MKQTTSVMRLRTFVRVSRLVEGWGRVRLPFRRRGFQLHFTVSSGVQQWGGLRGEFVGPPVGHRERRVLRRRFVWPPPAEQLRSEIKRLTGLVSLNNRNG